MHSYSEMERKANEIEFFNYILININTFPEIKYAIRDRQIHLIDRFRFNLSPPGYLRHLIFLQFS